MKSPTQALTSRFSLLISHLKRLRKFTVLRPRVKISGHYLRTKSWWSREDQLRIPFADRICSRPVKQCALKRAIGTESLSFCLSCISLKTTRTFTCGSRKDWRWVFPCFFCSRGTLVSHTKFQTSSSLFFSPIGLSRGSQNIREHIQILPFSIVLSRSRVFTFSTKSPRLCARLLRLPTKWCH